MSFLKTLRGVVVTFVQWSRLLSAISVLRGTFCNLAEGGRTASASSGPTRSATRARRRWSGPPTSGYHRTKRSQAG
eukprot:11864285-Alexandrium_andersonii.AAC.1